MRTFVSHGGVCGAESGGGSGGCDGGDGSGGGGGRGGGGSGFGAGTGTGTGTGTGAGVAVRTFLEILMCFGWNNHCSLALFGWDRWYRGHAFDLNVFVVVVCISQEYFFLFKEAIKQVLRYCSFQVVTPYHPKNVLSVGIRGVVGR